MAIEKNVPYQDTGAIVVYWRIIDVFLNYNTNTYNVTVSGYLNRSIRDEGYGPMMQLSYKFKELLNQADIPMTMTVLYNKVKRVAPAEPGDTTDAEGNPTALYGGIDVDDPSD